MYIFSKRNLLPVFAVIYINENSFFHIHNTVLLHFCCFRTICEV